MREFTIDGFDFDIADFEKSATATRLKINNKIPEKDIPDFLHLMNKVIIPIQKKYGGAIYITSGYRSPLLNKKVGGAPNSQHTSPNDDAAADISTKKGINENKRLFDLIKQMTLRKEIPIDQLINEYGCQWIHLSSKRIGINRFQIIEIK